jgi:hypothetical protein
MFYRTSPWVSIYAVITKCYRMLECFVLLAVCIFNILCQFDECQYAERQCTERQYAWRQYAVRQHAERQYAERQCAYCKYAER